MNNKKISELFNRWLNNYLVGSLMFSLAWSLVVLWPHLMDYHRVPVDTQNFYWMARFQDPALFTEDRLQYASQLITVDVFGKGVLLSPISLGYGLLFYFASFIIEPIIFGKLLVFVLMPLTVFYLFRLGRRVTGKEITGFVLSLLFVFFNLTSSDAMSVASGLQRAFALPILIIFAYHLEQRRYSVAAALIPWAALIYIPNLPLMVITYSLLFFEVSKFPKLSFDFHRKKLIPFSLSLLVAFPIIAWVVITQFNLFRSDISTHLVQDPERLEFLFNGFPWLGRTSFFVMVEDGLNFLVLMAFSVMIFVVVERNKRAHLPHTFKNLLVAGFLMYGLSLFVIFVFNSTALYLPSRYTRASLFLSTLTFVGINFETLLTHLPDWFRKNATYFITMSVLSLIMILVFKLWESTAIFLIIVGLTELLILILIGLSGFQLYQQLKVPSVDFFKISVLSLLVLISLIMGIAYSRLAGYSTLDPTQEERDLYGYIKSLPKDVVFAGAPDILTGVPLFAKRAVLFKNLHPDRSSPIIEALSAYYAEESSEIIAFCQDYDIDYLIWDNRDFSEEFLSQGDFFRLPYNENIQAIVAEREKFLLPRIKPEFNIGSLNVVKCKSGVFSSNKKY